MKLKSYLKITHLGKLTGYIYFIQMDRIGPIKIGFTKDIGKRLVGLQTGSPYPLNLLCLFPGIEEDEKEIHNCYYPLRLEGEWFLPHPLILKDINRLIETNKKHGFIEPIPEYDFHEDPFNGYIEEGDALYYKRFLQSSDFQSFKKTNNAEHRKQLIKKYVVGKHPTHGVEYEEWDRTNMYV